MIDILSLLLLSAVAQGPQQPPPTSTPPKPDGDPGAWVTVKDYPSEALADHREGKVAFRLDVDRTGAVTGCSVTQSSGAASLDRATCALLSKRAHFRPARDSTGKADAGTFSSRITWVYPTVVENAASALPAPAPVELRGLQRQAMGKSVLWVDENGIITACDRAPNPYSNVRPPPDICGLFPVGARYGPPGVARGKPVKRKVTVEISIYDVNVR